MGSYMESRAPQTYSNTVEFLDKATKAVDNGKYRLMFFI